MNERTLFGKPIRKDTTLEFYPNKINLDEFANEMNIDIFVDNMKKLKQSNKKLYIEEWAEMFLTWCEIEREKKGEGYW